MKTSTTRLARWGAIPALVLALTLAGPGLPVSAQGADDGAHNTAQAQRDTTSAPLSQTVAGTHKASFLSPEITVIPGFGVEIDTGGPAVHVENTADVW